MDLRPQPSSVADIAFDKTNDNLFVELHSGAIQSWNLQDNQRAVDTGLSGNLIRGEQPLILSGSNELRDPSDPRAVFSSKEKIQTPAAVSSDRSLLAFGRDAQVHIVDLRTGDDLGVLAGHDARVNDVLFDTDGKRVVTVGNDGVAKLWKTRTAPALIVRADHPSTPITAICMFPHSENFLSASQDGRVQLHSAFDGSVIRTLLEDGGRITGLAIDPSGEKLAVSAENRDIVVINARSGDRLRILKGARAHVMAFDKSGERVLVPISTEYFTRAVAIWSVTTGERLPSDPASRSIFPTFEASILSIAYDSKRDRYAYASGSENGLGSAGMLEGETGRLLGYFETGTSFTSVAFDQRFTHVAAGEWGGRIGLWDLRGAAIPDLEGGREFRGHFSPVRALAFTPGSARLISADEKAITVWDAASTEEILQLETGSTVQSLALSESGALLVSGHEDGTIMLWRVSGPQGE